MTVQKVLCRRTVFHFLFRQIANIFKHFFKHFILDKAVDTIKSHTLSAGLNALYENIKAFAYAQLTINCREIFFIAFFKITHHITDIIVGNFFFFIRQTVL